MDTFPNVFQPVQAVVYRSDYRLKGRWAEEVFGNTHPVVLEIGCGKGEYTVGLARLYPEKNFIGIDIKGARMWKGAKEALDTGLKNVAFLRLYAENLERVFAPDEVDEIWITFPDPQMSKARKRLTGCRFVTLYSKCMKPDGIIHLKTDSNFLFRYTMEMIRANGLPLHTYCADLYGERGADDRILGIRTFYEQQWLNRGKSIKYIEFSTRPDAVLSEPEVEIERDDYHSEARYMTAVCKEG